MFFVVNIIVIFRIIIVMKSVLLLSFHHEGWRRRRMSSTHGTPWDSKPMLWCVWWAVCWSKSWCRVLGYVHRLLKKKNSGSSQKQTKPLFTPPPPPPHTHTHTHTLNLTSHIKAPNYNLEALACCSQQITIRDQESMLQKWPQCGSPESFVINREAKRCVGSSAGLQPQSRQNGRA